MLGKHVFFADIVHLATILCPALSDFFTLPAFLLHNCFKKRIKRIFLEEFMVFFHLRPQKCIFVEFCTLKFDFLTFQYFSSTENHFLDLNTKLCIPRRPKSVETCFFYVHGGLERHAICADIFSESNS